MQGDKKIQEIRKTWGQHVEWSNRLQTGSSYSFMQEANWKRELMTLRKISREMGGKERGVKSNIQTTVLSEILYFSFLNHPLWYSFFVPLIFHTLTLSATSNKSLLPFCPSVPHSPKCFLHKHNSGSICDVLSFFSIVQTYLCSH